MLQEQSESLQDGFTIYTYDQTAGRGQAGNSWESEAGKNLLFSRLLRPNLTPTNLFRITQYVSLVVAETLAQYTDGITIKWPNDIYWHDKKLCGILIETAFAGNKIDYAIAGIGINVNQREFVSNAPNPISLYHIIGHEIDLEKLLQTINHKFEELQHLLYEPTLLHTHYMRHLYRRDGWHQYICREVSTQPSAIVQEATAEAFDAKIIDILSNGCLALQLKGGATETFHFKQVQYVLPQC